MRNIDLSGITLPGTGIRLDWSVFDGGNYELANLNHLRPDSDAVALFSRVDTNYPTSVSWIKNLTLRNFVVRGRDYVALLASNLKGSIIENVTTVGGTVEGRLYVHHRRRIDRRNAAQSL